jgi:fructose-1-phosphate kinase PfkB-like protein
MTTILQRKNSLQKEYPRRRRETRTEIKFSKERRETRTEITFNNFKIDVYLFLVLLFKQKC